LTRPLFLALLVAACGRFRPTTPPDVWHHESGYRWHALDGEAAQDSRRLHAAGSRADRHHVPQHRQHPRWYTIGSWRRGLASAWRTWMATDGPMSFCPYRRSKRPVSQPGQLAVRGHHSSAGVAARIGIHGLRCLRTSMATANQDLRARLPRRARRRLRKRRERPFQGRDRGLTDRAGSMTIAVADVDGTAPSTCISPITMAYTTLDRMSPQGASLWPGHPHARPNRYEVREQYRKEYKLVNRPDLGGYSLEQRADPISSTAMTERALRARADGPQSALRG